MEYLIIFIAIICILIIAGIINSSNIENQIKKEKQIYDEYKTKVIFELRDNAEYINQELEKQKIPEELVKKINITKTEDIYELSELFLHTETTLKEMMSKNNIIINENFIVFYNKRKTSIINNIEEYNKSVSRLRKLTRTFFGSGMIKKYKLENVDKILI